MSRLMKPFPVFCVLTLGLMTPVSASAQGRCMTTYGAQACDTTDIAPVFAPTGWKTVALDHVTFAGRVHPDQMTGHYAEHDIYVQSPDIDNMPISVLEAYACGLPVVSTEAGGVPAILTHGEHGLLAPRDDHAALAAHVLLLLEQPGLACELAEHARAKCDDFQWHRVRDQWLSHYRQVWRSYAQRTAARLRLNPPARAE